MTYDARVVRVLIASPSDVAEEREIAVRAIQEWNDLNSSERRIVLLPLRWETHSSPHYGERPQAIINRDVVDHCDLMIGIFWTRLGSSTGVAESGTLEELERVARAGKPVMLYFSASLVDPGLLDLEQLGRLRDFKDRIRTQALVETYSSAVDFRDKLFKHLEIRVRELLLDVADVDHSSERRSADIRFHFANPGSGASYGSEIEISSIYLDLPNQDEIPDYQDPEMDADEIGHHQESDEALEDQGKESVAERDASVALQSIVWGGVNKSYYRELALFVLEQNWFTPVRFWLKNAGSIGARDLYIDIELKAEKEFAARPASAMTREQPSRNSSIIRNVIFSHRDEPPLRQIEGGWSTHLELPALQPLREVSPDPTFFIAAKQDTEITVTARIFADILPTPIHSNLTILLSVRRRQLPVDKLILLAKTETANLAKRSALMGEIKKGSVRARRG